ncbi:hypothetical protein [Streptomyces albireticuli]|uniref:Uncharacterized protein n=1 Tax=Streptomyces albireticuli TaxID=1940 RepID=A0A2A2DBC0_9ACTN|nr:hypothetical protein [Streptomyces albireticuli]MCD9145479.1 hypothetical protein [Streptomyces albireticuli]MCD9164956.1 hypothetical protein [Streptomyces albireticuli]MCD9195453.1 hypothetical protein [Streptomyces albireticuli]PAU48737.1 hypothetical protein CK936_11880 [Streptomyces albireticuli]
MTPQNPAQHAKIAADALERLVRDVQSGRAQWTHSTNVRQAVDDLTRLSAAMATALHQMTGVLAQLSQPGPQAAQAQQTAGALHLAGQHTTTAANQLRQARRTMH